MYTKCPMTKLMKNYHLFTFWLFKALSPALISSTLDKWLRLTIFLFWFLCDSSIATAMCFLWAEEIRDAHHYHWWQMASCNVQCWLIKRAMFCSVLCAILLHTITQSILLSNKNTIYVFKVGLCREFTPRSN